MDKLRNNVKILVESLNEQLTDTTQSVSMTNATELYWGSSGRGNPNAKSRIRAAATLGYVAITKRGRNEYVSLTAKGIELANAEPFLSRY